MILQSTLEQVNIGSKTKNMATFKCVTTKLCFYSCSTLQQSREEADVQHSFQVLNMVVLNMLVLKFMSVKNHCKML